MFTLTDAGRAELRAYSGEPARPAAIRDEFLVKLQAMDGGDPAAMAETAAARLARAEEKLAPYDHRRDRILAGRSEEEFLRDGERVGPYLTLMAGRMCEQQNIRWTTTVLEVLRRRAGDG